MKKLIYQTIVGLREGFVVNIDYDKKINWSKGDNFFIIISKGCLDVTIEGNTLTITADSTVYNKPTYVVETTVVDLEKMHLNEYEHYYAAYSYGDCIIIRLPKFMYMESFENGIYVNNIETAAILNEYFTNDKEKNIKITFPNIEESMGYINDMITTYSVMLSHIEYDNGRMAIITRYNSNRIIRFELNKKEVREKKLDSEFKKFAKQCSLDDEKIDKDLDELISIYSDSSYNPYERISRHNLDDDINAEYYKMLKEMKKKK